MKINIIGLGPGSIGDLTLDAVEKIMDDKPKFLRTERHPTVDYFREKNINYRSFDSIYDSGENFDKVYDEIVNILLEESKKHSEINYFVPGNPMVAERTVNKLLNLENKELEIVLVSGLSFIEPILEGVGYDLVEGLSVLDAINFSLEDIDINSHCIVTQVYNERIASDLKILLSEVYGDEYIVYLINNGGIKEQEEILKLPLYEIDRNKNIGNLTSLFIPKVKEEYAIYSFSDIIHTMKRLRDVDGCPWDRKQDHNSLRKYLLEETYELLDAIEKEDIENTIEELGDVLFQVVFHSQIAYETGDFNIYDVTSNLNKKMIYRHPHVFSDTKAKDSSEVKDNWEELKAKEKNIVKISDSFKSMPSQSLLLKSYKLQEKAAKVGFDWKDIEGPLGKIREEYKEVLELLDNKEKNSKRLEEEIGDLLFSVVNLSRFLDIDPNIALNKTINKFINRFEYIEDQAIKDKIDLRDMTLEDMDKFWNKAKEI